VAFVGQPPPYRHKEGGRLWADSLGIGGKNSKQQNQAVGNLNNLYNFGFGSGKSELSSANSNLSGAGDYFNKILSGNRSAVQSAVAPETNMVRSASDAQRRQQGTIGTARGGGVAATNQTRQDTTNAAVDNAIFSARPAAAEGAAKVGSEEAAIAGNLFGTAGTATSNAGDIATRARSQAAQEQAAAISAGIGLIFG
jgi:hypothetical protein